MMCEIMRQTAPAASANCLKTPHLATISLSCPPMADRSSKSDADRASVDTLLEGVLGGDVQSAKARIPKRARQETAPGLSVIIEEEPPMGGRRRPFLSEEEEVARMAPTVPPATRKRDIPRDTVVDDGAAAGTTVPLAAKRHLPGWAIALIVVLVAVTAFTVSRRISAEANRTGTESSSPAASEKTKSSSSSAAAMAASAPSALPTGPLMVAPAPLPTAASPSASSGASAIAPASTYGHLVPGGRH